MVTTLPQHLKEQGDRTPQQKKIHTFCAYSGKRVPMSTSWLAQHLATHKIKKKHFSVLKFANQIRFTTPPTKLSCIGKCVCVCVSKYIIIKSLSFVWGLENLFLHIVNGFLRICELLILSSMCDLELNWKK